MEQPLYNVTKAKAEKAKCTIRVQPCMKMLEHRRNAYMECKNIKLLIVEDDEDIREEYRNIVKKHNMLQIVAETENQEEAIDILKAENIDAVILDLELPQGSGMLILEKIATLDIQKPFVAVVTNVTSSTVFSIIRDLGADYICSKRDIMKTPDMPFSIIELSAPYLKNRIKSINIVETVNTYAEEQAYGKRIDFELSRLGFDTNMSGTQMLKAAIFYALKNNIASVYITKQIYPEVAEQFQTDKKNIEKNIRNSIEKVWAEKPQNQIKEIYPYTWSKTSGRPTNKQFIYNLVDKIRHQE